MGSAPEKKSDHQDMQDEKKIAYRQLLEERAANNGTVIVIKDGVSQLVSARKVLSELLEQEKKKDPDQD